MTVGEVIAKLLEYCSDMDYLLMCKSIYAIEVDERGIIVHMTDCNTSDITISVKGMSE